MTATAIMPSANLGTPETYLDTDRQQGFAQQLLRGVHQYAGVQSPRSTSSRCRDGGG